jgi:hypothetical protein
MRSKEEIGMLKIHFNTQELVAGLPPPFQTFMQHLQSLEYADAPNYDQICALMEELIDANSDGRFDWEVDTNPRAVSDLSITAGANDADADDKKWGGCGGGDC